MQVVSSAILLWMSGRLQELHPQAGDARKIMIKGEDSQVAFQSGGNERVHIPD
jgi:hypothetical protein